MAHQAGQGSLRSREQHQASISGQNHNRIAMATSQPDVDISVGAKMLSATLGSVLTSLLGSQSFPFLESLRSNILIQLLLWMSSASDSSPSIPHLLLHQPPPLRSLALPFRPLSPSQISRPMSASPPAAAKFSGSTTTPRTASRRPTYPSSTRPQPVRALNVPPRKFSVARSQAPGTASARLPEMKAHRRCGEG